MSPELSQEELAQFKKWQLNKDARKTKGIARRKALTELKNKYKTEFNTLVKKFGGTVKE